ncbi:hypothetical protein BV898_18204 [Hypsibius exemplaris]|uniref:Uncharacterized protein n=1 Tax=Hypsibius exemplaris TaxID=2072580 RepID=A0A9X6NJK9_HYPEX|nr:hypothetical protein BV898_18204 [Hypsibius exemplaris]
MGKARRPLRPSRVLLFATCVSAKFDTSTAGQSIKRALAKTLHTRRCLQPARPLQMNWHFGRVSDPPPPPTNSQRPPRCSTSTESGGSRKDQWIRITPREMVWRIMRNKPFSLENYRSIEESVALAGPGAESPRHQCHF